MKTRLTIALIAVLVVMLSCTKTPAPTPEPPLPDKPIEDTTTQNDSLIDGCRPDTVRAPHYILGFWQPKYFTASAKTKGSIGIEYRFDDYCWYDHRNPGRDNVETERAKKYVALCERYGDITYTAERSFFPFYTGGYSYLMDNIVSINVISETNYDAEHPAGSSLNDICTLQWESPYTHIKSGYTVTHDWPKVGNGYWQQDKGSIPFSKPLAQCTAEDMILMGDGWQNLCSIKLTKLPLSGTKQLLTIMFEDESGKTYNCSVGPFSW